MARDRDISEVKKVLKEALKGFSPKVYIERSLSTRYLTCLGHFGCFSAIFRDETDVDSRRGF